MADGHTHTFKLARYGSCATAKVVVQLVCFTYNWPHREHPHSAIAARASGHFHQRTARAHRALGADQLREDHGYWEQCQQRWGMGPGYKHDIRSSTKGWFLGESRKARHEFVEREIQRRWQELSERLAQQLETMDAKLVATPA